MRALPLVVCALLSLAVASPSSAQGLSQTDTSGAVRLALVSQNLWVAPNGRLDATVHLDQQAPTGSEIAVVIYQRLRSRSLFQASLDGELGSSLATISRPIGDLPRDARGDIVVSVPLSDTNEAGRTRLRVDGVYPVRIEVRNEDGDEIDGFTTHLVRTTDVVGAKPLSVSMLIPLAAAPALAPDGTSQMVEEDHSALATLITALAAHPTIPLTIVPRPETLTALDASTSTDDRRLLDSLRASIGTREVVAGPYVAVDPASMLRDGLADELTTQLRTGSDTLAQVLAPARPDGRTWIADAPLDAGGLRGLRDAGVDQVVLREDLLTPTDLPFTLTRPAVLTTDDVTVPSTSFIDGGLARHFDEPSDPVLAATHLLADLSQLYFDSPSVQRGTVVAPPTDWTPSPAFLDTLLDGLATSPVLAPVTIDDYFRTVPRAVDDDGHPIVRSLAEPSTASLGSYGPALDADAPTPHRLRDDGRRGRTPARISPTPAPRRERRRPHERPPGRLPRRGRCRDQPADVLPPGAGAAVGDAHLPFRDGAADDPKHITDTATSARARDEPEARLPRRRGTGRHTRRRQHDGHVQGEGARERHVPTRRPSDIPRRHAADRK